MKTLSDAKKEGVLINNIYNADCLEIMKLMPDKSVDLVLTDPPYGIDFKPHLKKWNGDPNVYEKVRNDSGELNYNGLLLELNRIGNRVIIFGAENFHHSLPSRGSWICWDKRPPHIENEMIGTPFELAWINIDGTAYKMYRVVHGGVINADSLNGNNDKRFHPTQKPVSLFARITRDFSKDTDTIFDPFLGSGTTALAAKQLGRNFIGVELSSQYCEISEQRLRQQMLF